MLSCARVRLSHAPAPHVKGAMVHEAHVARPRRPPHHSHRTVRCRTGRVHPLPSTLPRSLFMEMCCQFVGRKPSSSTVASSSFRCTITRKVTAARSFHSLSARCPAAGRLVGRDGVTLPCTNGVCCLTLTRSHWVDDDNVHPRRMFA